MTVDTKKCIKYILFYIGIISYFLLAGCKSNDQKLYPENLANAINYFYLENQNDKVQEELIKTLKFQPDNRTTLLCKIFTAASICESNHYDSAAYLFQQIDLSSVKRNQELYFWYNSIKGLILFRQDQFSQAYNLLALTTSNPAADIRAIGLNERLMARICFQLGDYSKGIEWLLLSNNNFKKAGLSKSLAINNKILGRYYMTVGDYNQAYLSFKQAETELEKVNDKLELFYVYINYIDYYLKQNNLKIARFYANRCLLQCENIADNQMKTIVYNNMGEIELQYKNYYEAITYFQKTIDTPSDYTTAKIRKTNAHINLSKAYNFLNKPDEALSEAKKAQLLVNDSSQRLLQYHTYENLATCYNKNKLVGVAYCYLDTAMQNLDSAYTSVSSTTNAYYETKGELVNVSNRMEQLKLRSKWQHLLYMSIIAVLLVLSILAFIVYKLQQSKNKVLKELVKKNLEIIDEQKKSSQTVQKLTHSKKLIRNCVEAEKSEMLYNQVVQWLELDKHYCLNELSLEMVAKELSTNRDYLSKSINDQNVRFNDLINKYRIQEAIRIFSLPLKNNGQLKLSYIANQVGFNSNSVFIDAFRKQTGMNPAQFRSNLTPSE